MARANGLVDAGVPIAYLVDFDRPQFTFTGGPTALVDDLRTTALWGHGGFDLGGDGTLVYWPGGFVGGHRRLGGGAGKGGTSTEFSDYRDYVFFSVTRYEGELRSVGACGYVWVR